MKTTMRIERYCKTMKDAEKLQSGLYENWFTVELVSFPIFSEDGIYVFMVGKK